MAEHWWKASANQTHKGIVEVLERLSSDLDDRDRRWRRFLSIFMNKTVPGFNGERLSEDEQFRSAFSTEKRLTVNPIENCATTLAARIASQRPRASFLVSTDGPDAWDQKQKAEGLEKGVAGEWQKNKFYRQEVKVFQDAGAVGFSAMKHIPDMENRRVVIERTPPWELVVDESSAMTTPPRSLYHRMWLPADVVKAMFPNRKGPGGRVSDAIDQQIGRNAQRGDAGHVVTEDLVRVIEAWHLPAGRVDPSSDFKVNDSKAKGGRHSIVIDGCTLMDGVWRFERFPFAWFRWNEPLIGWYPQGLVEQQEPLQAQVNKLLGRIQEAAHLYAVMNTYYEDGSIDKKHLKNTSGNLIPYKKGSQPPKPAMPLSMPAEMIRLVWDLYAKIFEGTGVSQMSAASVKPAGIESGRGLMVLKDSESGRHALLNDAWDDFHTESAELTVQAAKELASAGKYETKYIAHKKLERINWKEVDMDRDAYEIQIFPSSMLPHEPAGRFEQVEQMLQAGFISKEQAQVLLKMPDLEQFASLETAAYEDIEMQIGNILVRGEDQEPMPRQNLILGVQLMTSAYLRGRQQGAPEERLNMILDWIERAEVMLEPPEPPPEMMPPEGEGPPMGPPPEGMPPGALPGPPPEMPPDMPPGAMPEMEGV